MKATWMQGDNLNKHDFATIIDCKGKTIDEMKAIYKQEGGSHYKNMAIQPITYIHRNGLCWYAGNIVKYATRFLAKNGKEDLKKVIHYAEMAIEEYYPEEKSE